MQVSNTVYSCMVWLRLLICMHLKGSWNYRGHALFVTLMDAGSGIVFIYFLAWADILDVQFFLKTSSTPQIKTNSHALTTSTAMFSWKVNLQTREICRIPHRKVICRAGMQTSDLPAVAWERQPPFHSTVCRFMTYRVTINLHKK